jgi:DNA repair protein RadA/Sms
MAEAQSAPRTLPHIAPRKRGVATIKPIRLADVPNDTRAQRRSSGMREFDQLLGGGIVAGSLVLVGGPPGTGKSTLLLQLAGYLAGTGAKVVYVSAEESATQTRMRAERLGVGEDIYLFTQTDLSAVLAALEEVNPDILIVDSIQTVALSEVESYAGSVAQVRDCTSALMGYAKRTGCATFIVGHVTKDGQLAGPRLLEHLVDAVLYFEGELGGEYRIVRASKNRFGSVDEICVFVMDPKGLREVTNPSELFLGVGALDGMQRPSGSCIVPCVVGSRPVLVEVQALVGESSYGTPRRLAANLDPARLAMVVAILERRAGMSLGGHDIYASVAGGLRVTEPAADLALALAIASAFREIPLPAGMAVFGELGLSGEVRPVSASQRRVTEAKRLGFGKLLIPRTDPKQGRTTDAGLLAVPDIAHALGEVFSR